jgi:hypothetical protein
MHCRLLSGPLVEITVGPEKRTWSLHRNLLCHHSPYLERQFGDDDERPRSNPPKLPPKLEPKPSAGLRLDLPDDSPAAFELLVKWFYQGRIDDVSALPTEKKWDYAEACQRLYMLCGRLELPQLQNIAIDQFRRGCYEAGLVPGPEEMRPIYEHTPIGSPFRKLVSRIAARQIMDPDGDKDTTTYRSCFEGSADFAIDVINAIRDGSGGKLFDDPTAQGGCEYHEHPNGQKCPSKRNGSLSPNESNK